jgi:hypothetical protein
MDFSLGQLELGLYISMSITVVVLLGALGLAVTHRPRAHIAGIATFLVSFLITLYFAETYGRHYTFDSTAQTIHFVFAFSSTPGTVVPLVTGYRHWTGSGTLKVHRLVARIWFAAVLASLGTGVWMLTTRVPASLEAIAEAAKSALVG